MDYMVFWGSALILLGMVPMLILVFLRVWAMERVDGIFVLLIYMYIICLVCLVYNMRI